MNVQDLRIENNICDFCYPDHYQELTSITTHLLNEKGYWIGGFSKEKNDEYQKIRQEFEKDRRNSCFCFDEDTGSYICKKHLIELSERM